MKNSFVFGSHYRLLGFLFVVGGAAIGCSAVSSDASRSGASDGSSLPEVGSGTGDGLDFAASEGSSGSGAGGEGGAPTIQIPEGTLTAGIFDDNRSFDFFASYRKKTIARGGSGFLPFEVADHEASNASYASAQKSHAKLDVSLVIDTTGSMGDELAYLKKEFSAFTGEIAEKYPNSEQRWSLVVYRDQGDDYVTRHFDFSSDLDAFRTFLEAQDFGGGGDYPEAPEEGIAKSVSLGWRAEEETAKLLFWVADAPHHDERAQALATAIESAQQSNVHIYPVASSGVDELTELTMRSAAQITHGRYLFLTSDSGIGGEHKEPTLPCYYVTTLKTAILRSIETEMTGKIPGVEDEELVRIGGKIEDGACVGAEAKPF